MKLLCRSLPNVTIFNVAILEIGEQSRDDDLWFKDGLFHGRGKFTSLVNEEVSEEVAKEIVA